MLNKWLYRRLPYFLRRRLAPQHSPFVIVAFLAFLVLLMQSVSLFFQGGGPSPENHTATVNSRLHFRKPSLSNVIGIDPKLIQHYSPDAANNFRCLQESSLSIPFDWVNDDFCDCQIDGSDEPSTGACQNAKFFCQNAG